MSTNATSAWRSWRSTLASWQCRVAGISPIIRLVIGLLILVVLLWWLVAMMLSISSIDLLLSGPRKALSHASERPSYLSGVEEIAVGASSQLSVSSVSANREESALQGQPLNHASELVAEPHMGGEGQKTPLLSDVQAVQGAVSIAPESAALTAAEAAGVKMRQAVGLQASKPLLKAVDVSLRLGPDCIDTPEGGSIVYVQFREESSAPRATSMRQLEKLVKAYNACPDGIFKIAENPQAANAPAELTARRFNEIKYFFIQHSVPKGALRYTDTQ